MFTFDKLNELYETHCNYNSNQKFSFGFGCWTLSGAQQYAGDNGIRNYKIIKVRVPLEKMCMLPDHKIRAEQMYVVEL